MRYQFTETEDAFRKEVRDFIRKELPERIYEGEEPYSEENFEAAMAFRRKLGQRKWIGIGWAKEWGGLGATVIEQMIFHEEMIYHHAPLDPQAYQVGPALITHGSDYLKKTFLAGTASQEILWAQGFSEPNAGSDLANLQTRAEEDGDDYVITGQKIWTSMAHRANWCHILTRTDPAAPKHKGVSYFVMDMKSPGITIVPLIDMSGGHHFNQVFLDKVRVPKRNMIGQKNQGWYVAMTTLENERSGIRDVASAARQVDHTIEALRLMRDVPGVRKDTVMRHQIAEMAIEVETGRMMSYRVGWMQANKLPVTREGPVVKVFASELELRACRVAMAMLGQYAQVMPGSKYAVQHGFHSHNYLRNIPNTIAAGSSEVNRNVIATRGLGLPR